MYDLVERGEESASIMVMYRSLNRLACSGDFDQISRDLRDIVPEKVTPTIMVGILRFLCVSRDKISVWDEVVSLYREAIEFSRPGKSGEILVGIL